MAKYWTGQVGTHDDFEHPITDVFIDGKTIYGPWAIMNLYSFKFNGMGKLGPGYGQRYEKQADGRWLKVEG